MAEHKFKPRFSLGMAILAMTLLCCALAYVAWARRSIQSAWRHDQEAAEVIRSHGGKPQFQRYESGLASYWYSPRSHWDRIILVSFRQSPRVVPAGKRFKGVGGNCELITTLAALPHLYSVTFTNTDIGDADLAKLAKAPNLRDLGLGGTLATDAGVESVINDKFLGIDLPGAATDRSGPLLRKCEQLMSVDASGCQITDQFVLALAGHPNLETLNLNFTHVTDKSILTLLAIPKLKTLRIYDTQITPEGRDRLRERFPDIDKS